MLVVSLREGCILGDPGADSGDQGKSKRAEKFRPFRLSLAPIICPWVSEDGRGVNCRFWCLGWKVDTFAHSGIA